MADVPPKIELEFDKNWNAILVVTCPQCNHKIKRHLRNLPPGSVIECDCGYGVTLTGDDLQSLQKSVDNLKRTLRSFGR